MSDFGFLGIHSVVELLERVSFVFKVSVLLLQDLFVLIQKATEIVNFIILQNLEPLKRLSDLFRSRNFFHFLNTLLQQVVLSFH
jgi:hypothetical protein